MQRAALLCAVAILAPSGAAPQQVRAHMEACTRWGLAAGEWGTRNSCDSPLTILFMELGTGRMVEHDVAPDAWFGSGTADPGAWMFTACPVGYAPNVRFGMESKQAILDSLYNCLPARPGA